MILSHHQGEATKIAVPIAIPIPVVAVETVLIEVAEIQPVLAREPSRYMCCPSSTPLPLEYS